MARRCGRRRSRCRSPRSTTPCTNSPRPGCCARSWSSRAARISTPTSPTIIISSARRTGCCRTSRRRGLRSAGVPLPPPGTEIRRVDVIVRVGPERPADRSLALLRRRRKPAPRTVAGPPGLLRRWPRRASARSPKIAASFIETAGGARRRSDSFRRSIKSFQGGARPVSAPSRPARLATVGWLMYNSGKADATIANPNPTRTLQIDWHRPARCGSLLAAPERG